MPEGDRHGSFPAIQIGGLLMKVIHRTDSLLMIEDRPWLIGGLMVFMALIFLFGSMALFSAGEILGGTLIGLVGVGVPLLIGALMVVRVRLVFDRAAGTLTRISRSVRGLKREDYPLDRLVEAQLGASTDSDGTAYRLELQLRGPSEIVPFTTYYTSGRRPERLIVAVNDWLTTPPGGAMPPAAVGNR